MTIKINKVCGQITPMYQATITYPKSVITRSGLCCKFSAFGDTIDEAVKQAAIFAQEKIHQSKKEDAP